MRTIMFYRIGNYYGKDNKQKIIGHLHMVRHDLQCPEQSSQCSTQQIFTPIGQHDTGDRRRDISQSNKLPNVPRRDNNEKIGRKRISYRPKGCQIPTDIQRQHKDIKAQHHDKQQRHRRNQPQVVDLLQSFQRFIARIARSDLERGHTRKYRTRPTRHFSGLFGIRFRLMPDS